MLYLLRTPFSTERYKTVADKARARAIMGLTVGLVVIYSLFLIVGRSGALAFSDMQGIENRLAVLRPAGVGPRCTAASSRPSWSPGWATGRPAPT
ncbi:MAG: hypothetical protein IPO91_29845 [Chloroflexi bacterium]|nr:hypothetical protein [Chloroflexota bacterium]